MKELGKGGNLALIGDSTPVNDQQRSHDYKNNGGLNEDDDGKKMTI